MFVPLTVLLSIFHLIYAEDYTESTVLAANIYDDKMLYEILHRLDLLNTTIYTQNSMLNQQIKKQQIDFEKDMDQKFIKQQNEFKKSINQLQNEFKKEMDEFKNDVDQQFTKQQEELEKGLRDLKLAIIASRDPANCDEALRYSGRSGIYKIKVPNSELEPFNVYCLSHVGCGLQNNTQAVSSSNAAWTIVLRRQNGTVDFYRNWTDYQDGFGDLNGEFFIGLDKLHELTQSALHELWIQMEDFEGSKRWAKYSRFAIGGKNENYTLNSLGDYTGNAGDSLTYHVGLKWTTKDVNNNFVKGIENCAITYKGAWWYNQCHKSNLNGEYLNGTLPDNKSGNGIIWQTWHGKTYSLKYVHMAIRSI